jgi:hypothetical protein
MRSSMRVPQYARLVLKDGSIARTMRDIVRGLTKGDSGWLRTLHDEMLARAAALPERSAPAPVTISRDDQLEPRRGRSKSGHPNTTARLSIPCFAHFGIEVEP